MTAQRVLLVWHADDSLLGVFADNPAGRAAAEALVGTESAEYGTGIEAFLARLRAEGKFDLATLIESRPLRPEQIRIEAVNVLHSETGTA